MSRIVSFRGQLEHGGKDIIPLHTNNGLTGYRIVKLEGIDSVPGTQNVEGIIKIYSVEPAAVDGNVNFSDQTLLAVHYYTEASSATAPGFINVVFDGVIFNQDIYVTYVEASTNTAGNYYIELEVMDLALDEATVATLKDIRNSD